MFRKILIANRGEIAVRVIRACHELGVEAIAVYSEADRTAPHVTAANDAVEIGPAESHQSYLDISKIIAAAKESGAEAIHPGYGFLAENGDFAEAIVDAGITFIGPKAATIRAMGDKTAARKLAINVGAPVAPATTELNIAPDKLAEAAESIGYPILVKAAAGGGGKGMRVVHEAKELAKSTRAAQREAGAAFGDERVFLERYIERPRHIEIQLLADHRGHVLHLGERECSLQRRHQKIIEESPAVSLSSRLRHELVTAAMAIANAVDYRNAGTIEFLVDSEENLFFLEMNTRLQVEHPVTELTSGVDIVQAQIRIAAGEELWLSQDDVSARGHAIECRICAEDPAENFFPKPGKIKYLSFPEGPGIRVDSGIAAGFEVPHYYDSLLCKLSVHADTRELAIRRATEALRRTCILGCTTNSDFLLDLLRHPEFQAGNTHTHFIPDYFSNWQRSNRNEIPAVIATALAATTPRPETQESTVPARKSLWETLGPWRHGVSSQ